MRTIFAVPRRSRAFRWAAKILAVLLITSGLLAKTPATRTAAADEKSVAETLVEAHNKERAREGLPPLKLEPRLEAAAKAHALDMAEREVMTHEGADGSTPSRRIIDAGYHYLATGENVAQGDREVPAVMQTWMESPPHKKNVLGDFTEIGAAKAEGKDGKPYWCVDFGKPIPKLDPTTAASDLVKRINNERMTAKLPSMAVDPRLAKFAQDQSAKLAKAKAQGGAKASFEGLDGSLYPNLAMSTATGQPDAEAVVKSLINSGDQKPQILEQFARIGVGYSTAEDGTPFWIVILANPKRR